jgi:hypothetical protein
MAKQERFEDEDTDSIENKISQLVRTRKGAGKGAKAQTRSTEKVVPKTADQIIGDYESNAYDERSAEYNFEVIRHYPSVRSFHIKKPLKKSLTDSIFDLLGKQ